MFVVKLDNNLIKTAKLIVLLLMVIRLGMFLTNVYYNYFVPDFFAESLPNHSTNLLVLRFSSLAFPFPRLMVLIIMCFIDIKFLANIHHMFGRLTEGKSRLRDLFLLKSKQPFS